MEGALRLSGGCKVDVCVWFESMLEMQHYTQLCVVCDRSLQCAFIGYLLGCSLSGGCLCLIIVSRAYDQNLDQANCFKHQYY